MNIKDVMKAHENFEAAVAASIAEFGVAEFGPNQPKLFEAFNRYDDIANQYIAESADADKALAKIRAFDPNFG